MAISLASLKRGRETKPPRMIVYGPHGIGKTTFAALAPAPVFVQTEDGVGKLEFDRFDLARSFEEVLQALAALATGEHSFRTVVLDSVDWTERLIHQAVRRDHGDKIFQEYGKGFVRAVQYVEMLLNALNDLRDKRGMTVILLAHAIVKRYESPDVEPYDRYKLDLHEKASSVFEEWCDMLLFANYKSFTTSTDTGFGQKAVRGVGTGERILYTEERPAFVAKNRYGLPSDMPFSWATFASALGASLKPPAPPAPTPAPAPVAAKPVRTAAEAVPDESPTVAA